MGKCHVCGNPMETINDQPYEYSECGLNVTLLGITQYRCHQCGEEFAAIPSPQKLHKVIGIETVDHPGDGQLVAYARKYFVAKDRMLAQ